MIHPELISSLLERFENTNALIVAPSFRGQTRNAILFRRDLFPELMQLTSDRDLRVLIKKYRRKMAVVKRNDETSFKEEYEKALK